MSHKKRRLGTFTNRILIGIHSGLSDDNNSTMAILVPIALAVMLSTGVQAGRPNLKDDSYMCARLQPG